MGAMKFRKKPVVVEAIQWTGKNLSDIRKFMKGNPPGLGTVTDPDALRISTLEGDQHHASIGDWIIKGVKGEFYPCKPDIFEATYELVGGKGQHGEGKGEGV